MAVNLIGIIKLIAKIENRVVEIGDYAGPVLAALIKMRERGPETAGTELTPDEVIAAIDKALVEARAIKATAQREIDALKKD